MKQKYNKPLIIRIIRIIFPMLERYCPSLAYWIFRQAFFIPIGFPFPKEERRMITTAECFVFKIKGKKIQCYSWGKNSDPYVLFLHGWAGRATQFRKFIPPFHKCGYRIIGIDGPAHGKSDGIKTSIIEFECTIKKLIDLKGFPVAMISHSFGGGVALFSASRGLQVRNFINIASPTIPDEIINSFLKGINGTWKTGMKLKDYINKSTGKKFEEFTSLHTARYLPPDLNLLLIHDDQDEEVSISHSHAFREVYPNVKLFKTSGLGHARILKHESVIERCLQFVEEYAK